MERMMVVGAGTMGRGIAHVGALAGYEVSLSDKKEGAVESALGAIRKNLAKGVERGKVAQEDMAMTGPRTALRI